MKNEGKKEELREKRGQVDRSDREDLLIKQLPSQRFEEGIQTTLPLFGQI